MKILARVCALACALELGIPLLAQVPADDSTETTSPKTITAVLALSRDMAMDVGIGVLSAEAAIGLLQANAATLGQNADREANFAFAAIDVGQRLVAAGKPVEAEKFFQQAEASLDQLVQRTADTQARDKALFLTKLSLIRGNFLNKRIQAKADIVQALALQPEDKHLQRMRELLAGASGPKLPAIPKG